MSQSSIVINNGNYIIDKGSILNNNSLITEIYMAVINPIGTYIYDLTLGSQLISYLKGELGPITRTGINDIVLTGLAPLEQSGRIINPNIVINFFVAGKVAFTINATDNIGIPIIFNWQNYGSN